MTADAMDTDVTVPSAAVTDRFVPVAELLTILGDARRLLLAGAGATPELAAQIGAEYLTDDPVTAAKRLSLQVANADPR